MARGRRRGRPTRCASRTVAAAALLLWLGLSTVADALPAPPGGAVPWPYPSWRGACTVLRRGVAAGRRARRRRRFAGEHRPLLVEVVPVPERGLLGSGQGPDRQRCGAGIGAAVSGFRLTFPRRRFTGAGEPALAGSAPGVILAGGKPAGSTDGVLRGGRCRRPAAARLFTGAAARSHGWPYGHVRQRRCGAACPSSGAERPAAAPRPNHRVPTRLTLLDSVE